MRTIISVIFVGSLIAALPTFSQDAARIYVYAQRPTAARSWLSFSCNGSRVAQLKQGTFFAMRLDPGRYTFTIVGGVPLSIDVAPKDEAFVRLDWNHSVGRPPIPVLRTVHSAQAHSEMKYLSYVDKKRVFSESVAKADPREPAEPRLKTRDDR
jgi:hypothetical protein